MPSPKDHKSTCEPAARASAVSRREVLAAGAAAFVFLQRRAAARPIASDSFFDSDIRTDGRPGSGAASPNRH